MDRHSDDRQPTLVGGGDSDDGFDRVASDNFDGPVAPQELEMTRSVRKTSASSALSELAVAASYGRASAAKNGHGTAARHNGRGLTTNGVMPLGGGELSPGPSRGLSPMKSTKRKGNGAGMGMYARVGGDGVDERPRRDFGMLEGNSLKVYQDDRGEGVFSGDRGEEGGSFEDGGGNERHSLALGRTGEVEGQMEVGGGGSRWDDDSDGSADSDVGTRSELVEPA